MGEDEGVSYRRVSGMAETATMTEPRGWRPTLITLDRVCMDFNGKRALSNISSRSAKARSWGSSAVRGRVRPC